VEQVLLGSRVGGIGRGKKIAQIMIHMYKKIICANGKKEVCK
jgi:hypothetical protein